AVDRWEAEADVSLGLGLVGAGEDLAVWKVLAAIGVKPASAGGVVGQVSIGRDQLDNLFCPQEVGDALLIVVDGLPGCDWVVGVELAGGIDKILVLGQRHVGILRSSVGREQRQAPISLPGVDAGVKSFVQLAVGLAPQRDFAWVGAAEVACVLV